MRTPPRLRNLKSTMLETDNSHNSLEPPHYEGATHGQACSRARARAVGPIPRSIWQIDLEIDPARPGSPPVERNNNRNERRRYGVRDLGGNHDKKPCSLNPSQASIEYGVEGSIPGAMLGNPRICELRPPIAR